jgi:hypothetical protein
MFGGYTPYNWESKNGKGPNDDNETFLFSLNLMKKFKKIKDGPSIYLSKELGPIFGNGDIYLEKDLKYGNTVNCNFLKNNELTQGEKGRFKVSEFEVYKVIFH